MSIPQQRENLCRLWTGPAIPPSDSVSLEGLTSTGLGMFPAAGTTDVLAPVFLPHGAEVKQLEIVMENKNGLAIIETKLLSMGDNLSTTVTMALIPPSTLVGTATNPVHLFDTTMTERMRGME